MTGRQAGRPLWGWAGSVADFLQMPHPVWRAELDRHHAGLFGTPPSASQTRAWDDEGSLVRASLRDVCVAQPEAQDWSIVFEYELPLEGGRRPDVVLLAGGALTVLEFKGDNIAKAAAVDQVEAYARDLAEYHEASHGLQVTPVLVLTRGTSGDHDDQVRICGPSDLAAVLLQSARPGVVRLDAWLAAPYAPLPSLVQAARQIFNHEPLPAIKRALSSSVPEAVDLLGRLAEQASVDGGRVLAFIAGVPGSGKTLAGLSLVYQRTARMSSATFLSGNGPLVEVLRDALQSKVFVRDLHAFIKTYGSSNKVPHEHVIVFDEAQRAWDADYMQFKHGIAASEPELLIDVGDRLPRWAALVGLVGDGQEIHAGEEAGLQQWRQAAAPDRSVQTWHVHCAPRLADVFEGLPVTAHDTLDLTRSLRSRRAEHLHDWVAALLAGDLAAASRTAAQVHAEGFPLYLTRDLGHAKAYARERYAAEPQARYGLLASSRAQTLLPRFGVDSSFPATKKVKLARWYNEPAGHPESGCALEAVVTEFGCQGLELDLPIVAWGDDLTWTGRHWAVKPSRAKYALQDPAQLRRNAYRVLLTRGRDGCVVFVPGDRRLDLTEHALLAAGVRPLPDDRPLGVYSATTGDPAWTPLTRAWPPGR